MTEPTEQFSRDRLTFLTYGGAVVVGFSITAPGPAMPFLRDELGISRTVGGLHFTAISIATVVFGLLADRMTSRWGRSTVFWTSNWLVALGAALIGLGHHPAVTIAGAALIGGPATAVLTVVQSSLADRHGSRRAVALTEGNMSTSIGTILPAMVIGGFAWIGIGWRAALFVPALLWGAIHLRTHDEPFPPPHREPGRRDRRPLSLRYRLFWLALIPGTAIEWAIAAWGAGYLVDIGSTSEAAASLLMTAFFVAMTGGRWFVSRLARRASAVGILAGGTMLGVIGFAVFWGVTALPGIVTGLFLAGLGISAIFPMLLSLAVGAEPRRVDRATARVNLAAGIAFFAAPQTLGIVADRAGIRPAFGLVAGLFALLAVLAVAGHRTPAGTSEQGPLPVDEA